MVVTSFPEKRSVETGSSIVVQNFGKENILLNAKAKNIEYNNLKSPFSLKFTLKGAEWYEVDGTDLLIDESNFLILNDRQKYSSHISSEAEVESFCFFFRQGVFDEVYGHQTSSVEALLDNPHELSKAPYDFVEKRYQADGQMKGLMWKIKSELETGDLNDLALESHVYNIMTKLLEVYQATCREIHGLPYERKSTKVELYKRIYRAKDFIDSSIGASLELDEVAEVACMSKFHFLRSFKQIIKAAPHQYITAKRLERAKELIKSGQQIQEACWAVGFANQYSFSRLFKNQFGITPSDYRYQDN